MTKKELSQLYYLNREIEVDKRRLSDLRAKATGAAGTKIGSLPGGVNYENHLQRYIADIVDLEAIITAKIT